MTTSGRLGLHRRLAAHAAWADVEVLHAVEAGAGRAPEALREYLHVLAAAEIWLARIEGRRPAVAVWPDPADVDPRALRERVEDGYAALLAGMHEAAPAVDVRYRTTTGTSFTTALDDVLLHVALHAHYHRGKVNALLRAAGAVPAPVDLIAFARAAASDPAVVPAAGPAAGAAGAASASAAADDTDREVLLQPVTMANRGDLDDIEPGDPERFLVHSNWYWHQVSLERPRVAFRLVHPGSGGEAVGMVAYGPRYDDRELTVAVPGDAEIHHVVIDHRHRGRGSGRAVVAAVLQELRAQAAYRRVVVAIHPDNRRSQAFFGGLGATPLDDRNYDGDPLYELVGALTGAS